MARRLQNEGSGVVTHGLSCSVGNLVGYSMRLLLYLVILIVCVSEDVCVWWGGEQETETETERQREDRQENVHITQPL